MFNKRLMAEALPFLKRRGKAAAAWQAVCCVCTVCFCYFLAKAIHGAVFLSMGLAEAAPFLAALLFVVCVRAVSRRQAALAAYCIAADVQAHFRRRLTEAFCYKFGPAGLLDEKAGELTACLNDGVEALEAYFTKFLPLCFTAVIMPLIVLSAVLPADFFAGLVFLFTAPLLPFFMFLIGRRAERANRRQWESLARLSADFLDLLEGMMMLRVFNQAGRQEARVEAIGEDFRRSTMTVLRTAFLSAFVLELTATLGIAIIAVSVGLRLLAGRFVFEQALFLLLLAPEFYQPLRQLGSAFHQAVAANTAADRLYGLLDKPGFMPAGGAEILPEGVFGVAFREVTYAYQIERGYAADHLSFTAAAGTYTAIVGASGAGKSTVFQLLLGFIAPQSGQVLLGGRPLADLDLPGLRKRIAYLPQQPYLFAASAADNIALGKPQAARAEIVAAATKAGIHDFIEALPKGYATLIGSGGKALSGGEKQRIAIARAFLQDADLILLDEIFTGLDAKSSETVQGGIAALTEGKTVIAITHSLSLAARADKILVLADGKAAEQGTHEALLKKGGLYAALWRAEGGRL